MDDPTQPSEIAHAAAESVRKLNHCLVNAKEVPAPELSATVQALITLVARLPQTLSQLSAHLVREQRAGQVRMEDGSDSAKPVAYVDTFLTDAETDVSDVSKSLHAAGSLLFKMGAPWPGQEDA
ncbi:hypothetical protein [Streptomyces sp. gCLA4]|uniref:hypothetical protein n=1 Tax=Streptomyces sp. gCLA4 TaxID=1873416 RepID=UPI001600DA2E|nr:hypothetical protein [Streptomyces sp. gCLA4]